MGVILGFYRENGKENGNYYIIMGCVYIYIGDIPCHSLSPKPYLTPT